MNRIIIFLFSFYLCFNCLYLNSIKTSYDWSDVDKVLENAIQSKAFPGCVALIGAQQGVLYTRALGNFTFGVSPPQNPNENPQITLETIFDLASVSKVVAGTTAIAQFYQRGEISLDARIVDILGEEFGVNGKEDITILNCLLHNAGFPADPIPNYWDVKFQCPETSKYYPDEVFTCQSQIYDSLMKQTLQNPIGVIYLYSDLSLITLGYVVGRLAMNLNYIKTSDILPICPIGVRGQELCYFEAYVRKYVFEALGMQHTQYLPDISLWSKAAPTTNDTTYRHKTTQGQVDDGNAYAMGGIAGHAGVFSTASDLYNFMYRLMFPKEVDEIFLNTTTVELFTKEYNHSQSSRALGWNTNDPDVYDQGWSLSCGNMSSKTYVHTGYTGTQLCGDPTRKMFTMLLTNRVYPDATNQQIKQVRQQFNSAACHVFDAANNSSSLSY
eukprot:TRINITY_DN3795_c0_g1_i1.p1 TRINITY_DN3795_c0_g1~~TRINITY_DN3795_c0_g1_i1.p1  ORF type:complete len:441 (+),score=154.82 TRINITY_DN3795_c0_g1_i1:69-1391(+)